ncbi:phage replisome organizer N-terminal domain-containing protein [Lysinibacillus sphaericus]|uniref:phage replisome organizer N-terminal domain-containing protein n=1 Tax=Lysinibacillus sphaericus TaxID=1421 RepID=UPI0018CF5D3B|nr:phage replisome organizer N-terminal domain-containing protein [Lysinibacillus sphaericus]
MADSKKYYWLKLKDDFFRDKRIKKLRKIAGGDIYTIIYLKMQLLSLKDSGVLFFEGVEDEFYEEVALEIDEEPGNVKMTILFLHNNGLLEEVEKDKFILPETIKSIGSESSSAARVRKHRESQKALQCNTDETYSNAIVTNCNTETDTEKDIDIDKDIDKETDREKNVIQSSVNYLNDNNLSLLKQFFKNQIGKENSVRDVAAMEEALQYYEPDLILEAIKVSKKAKTFTYILGVLNNWRTEKNINTYVDFKGQSVAYKPAKYARRKEIVPNWFYETEPECVPEQTVDFEKERKKILEELEELKKY